ncbi:hypothetical protein [Roseovarius rhodophyticola]|uniref:Uncharacterized protein n=1 Tax=Roseovarius rhodophyticola TaxID=3080827 RepID=A0ABZ2TFM3_9RHOB|nr:hypothetical protein [Roseovarius sp. W115]MDV2930625.1 hypothetical protein [Roseovarius sp. W115]
MTPQDVELIGQRLPKEMVFPYFADRESAWVLAACMPASARIGDLRKTPVGKLLDRPALLALVARCGGVLHRDDVLAVAYADQAMGRVTLGPVATAGVEAVFGETWHDFYLSFDIWGDRRRWYDQTTRQNANLVVQMGFPSDHAALMGRYLQEGARKDFEWDGHPIRTSGRPTLAWARLDIDLEAREALIDEVQTDWLRNAGDEVAALRDSAPRSRALAQMERYESGLVDRYGKIWSRAMLLAALMLLRDGLGVERVWMHQPTPGKLLKRINGVAPPRSLYTSLPRSFCFAPTRVRPGFLRHLPKKLTKTLPKDAPLFWQMEFGQRGGRIDTV